MPPAILELENPTVSWADAMDEYHAAKKYGITLGLGGGWTYIGSHWTDEHSNLSSGEIRGGYQPEVQLGEGLYLTNDDTLGLKAGWSKVQETQAEMVVEWRVYRRRGSPLKTVSSEAIDRRLQWKEVEWASDPENSRFINDFDAIEKPAAENEIKLNPGATGKVHIVLGRTIRVHDYFREFQRLSTALAAYLKTHADVILE